MEMSASLATHQELADIDNELLTVEQQLTELKQRKRKLVERKAQIERLAKQKAEAFSSCSSSGQLWESETFAWSAELKAKLTSVFKLKAFRPVQLSAINASLSGEDVILIMSTGGGKSLCYQLPALIGRGFSLVVSPLVSLMEDQIMSLQSVGVDAAMLTASSSKEHVNYVHNAMVTKGSNLKLVYVTPEKLAKSKRFLAKLEVAYKAGLLNRVAIDEVHCCSAWGHDFRPDYKILNILKRQFANTPIIGTVVDDVKQMLGIHNSLLFRSDFNRNNLFYEVVEKPSDNESLVFHISSLIKSRFSGQSGIVYCFSRKESEEFAHSLRDNGVKAVCYHADLDSTVRSEAHRLWANNKCQVIVATVAFGMGIDKADVRFVIHHSLPKSVENYFQESGRAGRDGERAACILFYKFNDVFRQSTMVTTEQTGLENLYRMVSYCHDLKRCRRLIMSEHFGEKWEPSWCKGGMCDNCLAADANNRRNLEVAKYARQILAILTIHASADKKLTCLKLVDLWLRQLKQSNKHVDRAFCERVVGHLLLEGYLREDFHFTPYNVISYVLPANRSNLLHDDQHSITIMIKDSVVVPSDEGIFGKSVAPSPVGKRSSNASDAIGLSKSKKRAENASNCLC